MAEITSESVADFIPELMADFVRNTHPDPLEHRLSRTHDRQVTAAARFPAHLGAPASSRAGPGPDRRVQKNLAERAGAITATLDPKTAVVNWITDEMGLGQQNPRRKRLAGSGTSPRAPAD